eukprot:9938836-Lingulodinium_polyedra.AAC.1
MLRLLPRHLRGRRPLGAGRTRPGLGLLRQRAHAPALQHSANEGNFRALPPRLVADGIPPASAED